MAIDYTMTERIASVKRRASIPTSQSLYTDADLASIMSYELLNVVVPKILAVREDYFLTSADQSVVSGTQAYRIPSRAIGDKLKELHIVDNNTVSHNLPRLSYDDLAGEAPIADVKLYGFYLKGNEVVLYPDNQFVGKTLRMYYYRRPNNLIVTSSAGKITALAGNVATLDVVPTAWTTSDTFDVISGSPGFHSRGDDQVVTDITGLDVTFSSIPTGTVVGDYVALSGESPIPQIPYDAFGWLEQRTALKCVEGIGNAQELQAHGTLAQDMEARLLALLTPRVDEESKKVVNRRGIFRVGRGVAWPR